MDSMSSKIGDASASIARCTPKDTSSELRSTRSALGVSKGASAIRRVIMAGILRAINRGKLVKIQCIGDVAKGSPGQNDGATYLRAAFVASLIKRISRSSGGKESILSRSSIENEIIRCKILFHRRCLPKKAVLTVCHLRSSLLSRRSPYRLHYACGHRARHILHRILLLDVRRGQQGG